MGSFLSDTLFKSFSSKYVHNHNVYTGSVNSEYTGGFKLKINTALEYSTRVVQEGGRRCKKSTLNNLVHLIPLRIPLMNRQRCVRCVCVLGGGGGEGA